MADRINLGLIPTSSLSWETACVALHQSRGGWLHIQENVEEDDVAGSRCMEDNRSMLVQKVKKNSASDYDCCTNEKLLDTGAKRTDDSRLNESRCTTNDLHEVLRNSDSGFGSYTNIDGPRCICKGDQCIINETFKAKRLTEHKREVWCRFVRLMILKLENYFLHTSAFPVWDVKLLHIELVKSYAPRIDHVVFDVECRPIKNRKLFI